MTIVAQIATPRENAPTYDPDPALAPALRDYATRIVETVHENQRQPSEAQWWCPAAAAALRMFTDDDECCLARNFVDAVHGLRGMDGEVCHLVDEVGRLGGDAAARRAIVLVAFIAEAWLDGPERERNERELARAVDAVGIGMLVTDGIEGHVYQAALGATTNEPFEAQWLVWYPCVTASLCDGRWIATCAAYALGEMIDALEADRRTNEELDRLASFLRYGTTPAARTEQRDPASCTLCAQSPCPTRRSCWHRAA